MSNETLKYFDEFMETVEQTVDIKDVYRTLKEIRSKMVTKEELNQAVETIAVLSNEQTMARIVSSEADIQLGRIRKISSVQDL